MYLRRFKKPTKMKSIFTFWALLVPVWLSAQSQVWQVPVVHHDIQLRLPEATVLDSIIIDVPHDGNVFLRFDGNCTASLGDRIIMAASDRNDWETNDGNTDVRPKDSLHLTQAFNHTRVYPVTAGQHTMYAVAHNYAGTDGTGIASFEGQFTVMYVPKEEDVLRLNGKGVFRNAFIFPEGVQLLDSVTIEVPEAGELLVSLDAYIDMENNDSAWLTLSLDPVWPAQAEIIEANMSDEHFDMNIIHRQLFSVGQGTHTIHILGRKVIGDFETNNNFLYGTLALQFLPAEQVGTLFRNEVVVDKEIFSDAPQLIGEVEVNVPEDGTLLVQYTGLIQSAPEEIITVSLVQEAPIDSTFSERLVQSEVFLDPFKNFAQGAYLKVQPGVHRFAVYADYDDNGSGAEEKLVKGMLTAQFFKEPVVSAVDHTLSIGNEISWYPNPTTGLIYAKTPPTFSDNPCLLSIYNAAGQLVHSANLSLSNLKADLSKLPEGIYQVSLKQGDKVETQGVVKTPGN